MVLRVVSLLCVLFTLINSQVIEDVLCGGRIWEADCPASSTIRIIAASFGKTDGKFCGGNDTSPWTVNCAVDVAETLRTICGGKSSCDVPVEGRDLCTGTSKYLQVIWACETGIPQNIINNKGINIYVSMYQTRINPIVLHRQTIKGSNLYVFLDPVANIGILEVKWFLDQGVMVVNSDYSAPFEFYPGNSWDTTTLSDGIHRVLAVIEFSDGTTGSVDATVMINNAIPRSAASVTKASDVFIESGTITQEDPKIPTYVPWALFGVSLLVVLVLIVVIIVKMCRMYSQNYY